MRFARRIDKVKASGIRQMFDRAQTLENYIDLSIGQPDFRPPPEVQDRATEAIKRGLNKYTVTKGLPILHDQVFEYLKTRYGYERKSADDAMITAGATGALSLAMLALVDEGDEVLIPDPYFVLYRQMVNICQGTPVLIDTYPTNFRLTPELLKKHITRRTRCLIFNNPVNPTGVAYTSDEIKSLVEVLIKSDVIVVSDEVYGLFTYDFAHETFLKLYENTVLVGGYSKTLGIPGWRLGYAVAHKDVIDKMSTLQQFIYTCAPAPLQHGVIDSFKCNSWDQIVKSYRKKRDLVCSTLSSHFELERPQGAFYAFPQVPRGDDASFVAKAFENNVIIVPGSSLSERNTHFRLSFAIPDEKLIQALNVLNRIA